MNNDLTLGEYCKKYTALRFGTDRAVSILSLIHRIPHKDSKIIINNDFVEDLFNNDLKLVRILSEVYITHLDNHSFGEVFIGKPLEINLSKDF